MAEIAVEADHSPFRRLLSGIRDSATDAKSARRYIERHGPAPLRKPLVDLFASTDFAVVLAALEGALAAAAATRKQLGSSRLAWTGPSTRMLEGRPTRAVVAELIADARSSLTLVTYAGHKIGDLVKELDKARLERDVSVRIVLETKEDSPKASGPEPMKSLQHLPYAVPIYRWPKEKRGKDGGSMHAKCVIRDRQEALISSANLTSAALDRNMELGVLIAGGDVALRLEQHYDDLIHDEILVRVEED
ncbi:DISARM system phospholipase D-like protein DrmC [Salsipaludibacter albus]|uniref:DISARM system phospholipase D-like protein DrmC n=1 Tax=Salsipaludibacter albus TaxID=2849650 RepID=UPI001EE4722A|nr:DISARM system phospholipase D-like protein DrmC [Salsipaludibacter albus]